MCRSTLRDLAISEVQVERARTPVLLGQAPVTGGARARGFVVKRVGDGEDLRHVDEVGAGLQSTGRDQDRNRVMVTITSSLLF